MSLLGTSEAKEAKRLRRQEAELRRNVAEQQNIKNRALVMLELNKKRAQIEAQSVASGTTGSSGEAGALSSATSTISSALGSNYMLSAADQKSSELIAKAVKLEEKAAKKKAIAGTALAVIGTVVGGPLGGVIGGVVGAATAGNSAKGAQVGTDIGKNIGENLDQIAAIFAY